MMCRFRVKSFLGSPIVDGSATSPKPANLVPSIPYPRRPPSTPPTSAYPFTHPRPSTHPPRYLLWILCIRTSANETQ
ncbi:hypothetical protein BDN70DRAFT_884444 [Pholiota conissans]|uniref:Uncharacterized protein n=1 Tax=Pholiota conissans TaxID=109636 RepID=A0A9P5YVT5_9AGAR|nr:hypothetical protein BDN70DRAFT_884444 [Pholiota conissans]